MANLFQQIKLRRPGRNKFNLSHERKMAFNMGELVPCMVQEVVPGDKFRVNPEIFLRFQPMLAPIMHNINTYVHHFFVPNRLVWDEWEEFITRGREGTSEPVQPFMSTNTIRATGEAGPGSLADFLGLPNFQQGTALDVPVNISALPFRAYQLIWNEYFRDQNLQEELNILKTSGEIAPGTQANMLTAMRQRAWEKDYFTSALPWSQRGPEVLIPMEGAGEVTYLQESRVKTAAGTSPNDGPLGADTFNDGTLMVPSGPMPGAVFGRIENIDEVTLGNTSVTINELRRSIRLQEWLEKNARAGARYVEQILSHFGVRSSDARLQRPEFLGGGRVPVRISEVLSTFQDADGEGNPQANMAGHAISYGANNGFRRFFEEHGYVISVMSVIPKTAYQQGIPKHFQRFGSFDYYWPEFANIGEQEVRQSEIYYTGASGTEPTATFGYQSRYAEYKYGVSTVHGELKTNLNFWHAGRIFDSAPGLNDTFITANPTDRIFAVQDSSAKLICQLYNRVDALRPMPYFGTPTL